VNSSIIFKVEVRIEVREDGGLRAWSEQVPELVLSHADAEGVVADIPHALEVILSERLGKTVRVEALEPLPLREGAVPQPPSAIGDGRREFAALAA